MCSHICLIKCVALTLWVLDWMRPLARVCTGVYMCVLVHGVDVWLCLCMCVGCVGNTHALYAMLCAHTCVFACVLACCVHIRPGR
jgi:hypothetical protein